MCNVVGAMTSQTQFFVAKIGPSHTMWALVPRNGLQVGPNLHMGQDH